MGTFDLFTKKQKTMEELTEENERLKAEAENQELELTIEEKRYAFNKMKEAGLDYRRDFGSNLKRLWRWANK